MRTVYEKLGETTDIMLSSMPGNYQPWVTYAIDNCKISGTAARLFVPEGKEPNVVAALHKYTYDKDVGFKFRTRSPKPGIILVWKIPRE